MVSTPGVLLYKYCAFSIGSSKYQPLRPFIGLYPSYPHPTHVGLKALVWWPQCSQNPRLGLLCGEDEFRWTFHRRDISWCAATHLPIYPSSPHVLNLILGIVIILFFQCMNALLNPADRPRGGIKWPLVVHTVAMFSFVTIYDGLSFDLQSISSIDNREYPGYASAIPPGPIGYQELLSSNVDNVVPNIMFLLNSWLADGLLVSSISNPVSQVSNAALSSSCIVAILFMPRTIGTPSFHV